MTVKVFYSPSAGGFFQTDFHKTIPEDAIEISDEYRWELITGSASNKEISVVNGLIILTDKSVSPSVLISQELSWRNSELKMSDIELYKAQDSDINSTGSVATWRSYRKALRVWPEHSSFPDKNFRPISPKIKDNIT